MPGRSSQRESRAAAQGFRKFPGYQSQERHTLRHAFQTILQNPNHIMRKVILPGPVKRYLKSTLDDRIKHQQLIDLIPRIIKKEYVCVIDTTPPSARYSEPFLQEFFKPDTTVQSQTPTDDEETILDPPLSPDLLDTPSPPNNQIETEPAPTTGTTLPSTTINTPAPTLTNPNPTPTNPNPTLTNPKPTLSYQAPNPNYSDPDADNRKPAPVQPVDTSQISPISPPLLT